jgi:pimeloyl-ACP methyl ester carboxylesterase
MPHVDSPYVRRPAAPAKVHSIAPRAASRPTIVALHSSAASGRQWARLATHAAPVADVVAPDFHGHGAGPAGRGADADIVAADAARIATIAACIPGGVHLVGHSYGGAIALRVALCHPECVRSVSVYEPVAFRVLFDHFGRRRPAAEVVNVARSIRRHLRAGDREGAGRVFIDYWAGTGTWAALPPERRASQAPRMPAIAAQFVALAGDAVTRGDYAALNTPVLYMSGRATRDATLRIAELLTATLPDARHVRMPGMGHLGPVTNADAVAARIVEFVRGAAGRELPALERRAA